MRDDESVLFVDAPYKRPAKQAHVGAEHEEENIEVLEMKFDEAFDMIATGEIKDAKTIMLLQYVKLNNVL